MSKRVRNSFIWTVVVLLVAGVVVYAAASAYIFTMIRTISNHCDNYDYAEYVPENFEMRAAFQDTIDNEPYQITAPYETVTFASRGQEDVQISAWYIPAVDVDTDAPTVIIQHGLTSCKRSPTVLMAASVLHQAGYHVLLPDLHEHGDSSVVDNLFSAGVEEYLDTLGGFDWLVSEKSVSPDNIGIMGFSLGAGTASIAFAQEPQLVALWEDSGFGDLEKATAYELRDTYGLPSIFSWGAIQYGIHIVGLDVNEYSPEYAFGQNRNGRPVFITHGDADTRVSVDFAYDLEAIVQADDPDFSAWIMEGVGHTDGIFEEPEEYAERLVAFFDEAFGR